MGNTSRNMTINAMPTSPIRMIHEIDEFDECTELVVSPIKAQLVHTADKATVAADLFALLVAAETQIEEEETAAKLKAEEETAAKLKIEEMATAMMKADKEASAKLRAAKKDQTPKEKKSFFKKADQTPKRKKFGSRASPMEDALWARASSAGFNLSLK